MTTPAITVLMPTYKGAKYIAETIDSILEQTFRDFELLIINDCSPDNTDEVVAKYSDPRIRYVKNEKNLGISGSSNYGFSIAKGKYIARQDHDDISYPTRLAEQFAYMEANPEVGICGTGFKVFGRKSKIVTHPECDKEIKSLLLFKMPMAHQTSMMRREVFIKNNLNYDETFLSSNDRKLWIDASPFCLFHNLPKPLLRYRMYAGMTSSTKRQAVLQEGRRLRALLYQKMGVEFSQKQIEIIDNYLMQGRVHIKDKTIIQEIEKILSTLVAANEKSHCFDDYAFKQICGLYFFKRCLNYSFFAHRSSSKLYNSSILSQYNDKIGNTAKLTAQALNFIFFWRR